MLTERVVPQGVLLGLSCLPSYIFSSFIIIVLFTVGSLSDGKLSCLSFFKIEV